MSDISVEKKMQLIQQVRSQYNRNQYDLRNREQILYGRTSSGRIETEETALSNLDTDIPNGFGTLKLRILTAVILLVAVVALDRTSGALFGITTSDIFQYIAWDFNADDLNLTQELNFLPDPK